MEETVYLNGSLIPYSQARISAFDHGFLYGYGLFETMRAYKGTIFLLDRHIKRLMNSAGVIGLASRLDSDKLSQACTDTLKANKLQDTRIRLTVSRGETDTFPGTNTSINPTVLVTAKSYKPLPLEIYSRGYKAMVSSYKSYSQSPLSRLKSTGYLLNVLAKMEAETFGLDEALLLNERGFITEGSISNVFFAASNTIITSPLESGILPGITREVVLELAPIVGIGVVEREVSPGELTEFSEVFLTNSVMEIMPLVEISDSTGGITQIGSGVPGKVTGLLMAAYREKVEKETQ